MTARSYLSIDDVRAVSACGDGVNHGASIAKFSGIFFGFIHGWKVFADALCAATANCAEMICGFKAKFFVAGHLVHGFLHLISCDLSINSTRKCKGKFA